MSRHRVSQTPSVPKTKKAFSLDSVTKVKGLHDQSAPPFLSNGPRNG